MIKAVLQGCLNALTNCLFNRTQHIDQSLTSCRVLLYCQGHRNVPCLSPVRCEAQWDHSCNDKIVGIIYFFKSINIIENVPFTCVLDKIVGAFQLCQPGTYFKHQLIVGVADVSQHPRELKCFSSISEDDFFSLFFFFLSSEFIFHFGWVLFSESSQMCIVWKYSPISHTFPNNQIKENYDDGKTSPRTMVIVFSSVGIAYGVCFRLLCIFILCWSTKYCLPLPIAVIYLIIKVISYKVYVHIVSCYRMLKGTLILKNNKYPLYGQIQVM